MKILIMTPSARDPKWGYIRSVESMEAYVRQFGVMKKLVGMERIGLPQCSNLPQGRQEMLDLAIRESFTHAIFIDDDMEFPANILELMFPRFVSDNPVLTLGANIARKDPEVLKFTAVDEQGGIVNGLTQAEPLMRVRDCGLGFFIFDVGAVAQIPPPHFEILWDKERGGYISEDRYFMRKLGAAGIDIFIDNAASPFIGHIGDFPYSSLTMRHKRAG